MKGKLLRVIPILILAGAAILYWSRSSTGFGFNKEKEQVFSGTIETREARVGSKAGGRVNLCQRDAGM